MKGAADNHALDQQYLKTMGIDLWVPRGLEVKPAAPTQALTESREPTPDPAPITAKPLAACSPAELKALLPHVNVAVGRSSQGVELLVVIEGPVPDAESVTLLGSMFGAIKIDEAQRVQAILSDGSSDSLQTVSSAVSPKAIVLMLRSNGNTNALDGLRAQQLMLPSLNSFAIVTFHPQDLIDNAELKRPAWEDLKLLRQWLG